MIDEVGFKEKSWFQMLLSFSLVNHIGNSSRVIYVQHDLFMYKQE